MDLPKEVKAGVVMFGGLAVSYHGPRTLVNQFF